MIRRIIIILGSISLSFHSVSFADDTGFMYVGGSLGYSLLNEDEPVVFAVQDPQVQTFDNPAAIVAVPATFLSPTNITTVPVTSNTNIDDEGLGWKVYGGYNFNKYFGFEIAYIDLDEVEADINSTFTLNSSLPILGTRTITSNVDIKTSAEVNGFLFAGRARYPFTDKIVVFGKLGGYVWNVDITTNIAAQTSVTSTSPFALPVSFINPEPVATSSEDDGVDLMFGLGVEYKIFENIGIRAEWERFTGISVDENDVDLLSVGVNYYF